ncbi:hypothetical protein [Pseudomonas coronafaciens]|uniref:hypothetical protein n=1 Tax=Pseudomonas coronafaciens TaxID=53409 RepID=UPI0006B44DC9|nr:hypothetical protein [Pseudomonas coronafaciens]KPB49641.1 Uncharacterized protein AC511_2047 [Pseudomonas coronafaciens pv. oryzae]
MSDPLKSQKILDALEALKNCLTEASSLRSTINSRFDSELRVLQDEKERGPALDAEKIPRSIQNMFYHDLKTGNATPYGTKHLFLDDHIRLAHIHKNRHYQWVLAEAYEAFEDFLEHIYAGLGYVDFDFWPMSDFGNTRYPDLSTKGFAWFLNQAVLKKNKPNSILTCFRNTFKELRDIEQKNKLDLHAGFEICLIAKLRHLIVHNSGLAKNKDEVIDKTLREAGINGKSKEILTARANNFFNKLKNTEDTHVYLLGHPIPHFGFMSIHNLDNFLGFMMSYAQILTEISFRHLYDKGLISAQTEKK